MALNSAKSFKYLHQMKYKMINLTTQLVKMTKIQLILLNLSKNIFYYLFNYNFLLGKFTRKLVD